MAEPIQRKPLQRTVNPQPAIRNRTLSIRDPFLDKIISGKVGDYKIVKRIGAGGMGVVYRALAKDARVAVKFLGKDLMATDDTAVKRFRLEASSLYKIKHPNVVRILDYGFYDSRAFLVMEYLNGVSLDKLLRWRLHWSRIREIALQTCDALGAAHRLSIAHRDIKPANIFRVHDPDKQNRTFIKIIDFGTAKMVGTMYTSLTSTGQVVGTPQYIAPELLEFGASTQIQWPLVDMYCTGTFLYQLLSGRLPFNADNMDALKFQILTQPPVPLRKLVPDRGIPKKLDEIVLRTLAKNPSDRFSSILDLKEAIADVDWDGKWHFWKDSRIAHAIKVISIPLAMAVGAGVVAWHFQKDIISFYNDTIPPAYYNQAVPFLEEHNIPHPELPWHKTSQPTKINAPKPAPPKVQVPIKGHVEAKRHVHSSASTSSVEDSASVSADAADTSQPMAQPPTTQQPPDSSSQPGY